MTKRLGSLFAILLCLSSSACAKRFMNQKIERYDKNLHGRMGIQSLPENSEDLSLVLAFSGGGTRAAALSYGVLETLAKIQIPSHGENEIGSHSMLDEVDYISSVSGGSFTAAYYALHGHQIFADFPEKFLYRKIGRALLLRMLAPWNWVKLASINFGRSDLAAEYYDRAIFDHATYQTLHESGHTGLAIQATDLVQGTRFSFTPSYFGRICSDLRAFPIARAVAASAAFPGPFGAVTLKNYARSCGYPEEEWIAQAMQERDTTSREFYLAKNLGAYTDSEHRRFIHLVDGGVTDNLGLRGPLEGTLMRGGFLSSLKKTGRDKIRKVAIIIVNAQTTTPRQWALLDVAPGLTSLLDAVSTTMINRYNFETIALLHTTLREWEAEVKANDPKDTFDFYLIEVSFDAVKDEDERQELSSISTSLGLSRKKVDHLRQAAQKILENSTEFQRLVIDLKGREIAKIN